MKTTHRYDDMYTTKTVEKDDEVPANKVWINLFSTAVYRNLYLSLFSSNLSPNLDYSPKRVKAPRRSEKYFRQIKVYLNAFITS